MWNQWIFQAKEGSESFVDVGGLWGTTNEKISVASMAGFRELTMADMQPAGNEWWLAFDARMLDHGVSGVQSIVTEATPPGLARRIGVHDVVHCSGVIYHVPSPFELLWNLASCANNFLIINSMVVPPRVENEFGCREIDPSKPVCVPLLDETDRQIYGSYFESKGLVIGHLNGASVLNWHDGSGSPDFAPWWWLFSPEALRNIIERASFKIVDEGFTWSDLSYGYVIDLRPS